MCSCLSSNTAKMWFTKTSKCSRHSSFQPSFFYVPIQTLLLQHKVRQNPGWRFGLFAFCTPLILFVSLTIKCSWSSCVHQFTVDTSQIFRCCQMCALSYSVALRSLFCALRKQTQESFFEERNCLFLPVFSHNTKIQSSKIQCVLSTHWNDDVISREQWSERWLVRSLSWW